MKRLLLLVPLVLLVAVAIIVIVPAATGASSAGKQPGSGGTLEVRGTVTTLTSSSITVTVRGLAVSCSIPSGTTLTVKLNDSIELKCDLVGDPAAWKVHVAEGKQEPSGSAGTKGEQGDQDERGDQGEQGSGKGNSSKVHVEGTIAASFTQTSALVTVTPKTGGAAVACAIVPGSLPNFAAGDAVMMHCTKVGATLTLTKIKKTGGDQHND